MYIFLILIPSITTLAQAKGLRYCNCHLTSLSTYSSQVGKLQPTDKIHPALHLCKWNFIHIQPHLFVYVWTNADFRLQWQSWIVATELIWSKRYTTWPFTKHICWSLLSSSLILHITVTFIFLRPQLHHVTLLPPHLKCTTAIPLVCTAMSLLFSSLGPMPCWLLNILKIAFA